MRVTDEYKQVLAPRIAWSSLDSLKDIKPGALVFLGICLISACASKGDMKDIRTPQGQCLTQQEEERLLALDQLAFDQDLSGGGAGWRAIAAKTGCEITAANLIRDYRERHSAKDSVIYWHEGQLRAFGNDYPSAVVLIEKSKKPIEQDGAGWNLYVDATIAFLKRDKPALLLARSTLSTVKAPPGLQLKDGVLAIPNNSGKPIKMRWPPNIDVVDGLIKCFKKSYRDAYSTSCSPAPPT
jgi:hypothetical protein